MAIELKTIASLDTNGFMAGMNRLAESAKDFSSGKLTSGIFGGMALSELAVKGIEKVGEALKSAAEYGAKLADAAIRTGTSLQGFQNLEQVAVQGGAGAEELAKGLDKVQAAAADAISGNEQAIKSFKEIGLSVNDLASMSPDQIFIHISKALTESGNSAQMFAAASDIIGKKTMPALIQTMNNVSREGFGQFNQVSRESAEAIKAAEDRWESFKLSLKRGFTEGLGSILSKMFGGDVSRKIQEEEVAKKLREQNNLLEIQKVQQEKVAKEAEKKAKAEEKVAERQKEIREDAQNRIKDVEERSKERIARLDEVKIPEARPDNLQKMGIRMGNVANVEGIRMQQKQVEIARIQADEAKEHTKILTEMNQKLFKLSEKKGGMVE